MTANAQAYVVSVCDIVTTAECLYRLVILHCGSLSVDKKNGTQTTKSMMMHLLQIPLSKEPPKFGKLFFTHDTATYPHPLLTVAQSNKIVTIFSVSCYYGVSLPHLVDC